MSIFQIHHKKGRARIGSIHTAHGDIETPAFLPCATHGSVRSVGQEILKRKSNNILLANAYHLYLRPGIERIERLGGLHKFMNWQGAILTDSGGFQAFALPKFVKYSEEGIRFQSHLDGLYHQFTPELVIDIQQRLGVDIATCLDVCTGFPATEKQTDAAVEQTNRWAERSIIAKNNFDGENMLLYGMVQGSIYQDLRRKSAEFLSKLPFDGYAIGGNMYTFGSSINELASEKPRMWEVVDYTTSVLPEYKPRHLLGVGEPSDIINGIKCGIDTFDCVMATRIARHGAFWIRKPKSLEYKRYSINHLDFESDRKALDSNCTCETCVSGYSRGYIRHLLRLGDSLAGTLLSVHNLHFIYTLIEDIKEDLER